jgi:signal transduction histidine kinase
MTPSSLLIRSARTLAAGFGLGLGLALAASAAALLAAPPFIAAALGLVLVAAVLARSTVITRPARALASVATLLARPATARPARAFASALAAHAAARPARAVASAATLAARVAAACPACAVASAATLLARAAAPRPARMLAAAFTLGAALAASAATLLAAPPLVAAHPSAALATAPTVAALLLALHSRRTIRVLRERAARVSHEVRGPLSAAHLALHGAARRGEVTPATVATLELELRRATLALEEPSLADPHDIDLHALLSLQVRTWHDVAAAHGTTLTLAPGIGTALVHADALRVAQATSNVLANAIEHGGGAITIRTVLTGDRVRVEVSDGGPGLPASIAEITRRPTAGRGTRGRGLAIASTVLSHCGGRLTPLPTAPGVAIDLPRLSPSTADQPA